MSSGVHPKFPNPRNDNPSVLSVDRIDEDAFVWIGKLCANSNAFDSCFWSFLTSSFVLPRFRELSPSER